MLWKNYEEMARAISESAKKSRRLSKTLGRSIRRSAALSPKYALVILHSDPAPKSPNGERSVIDYISLALDLLIFGCFAAVGTVYYVGTGENTCRMGVPLYLMIAGYTNLLLSVLRFAVPLIGTFLQCTFNLAMCIYGGVLVFGHYHTWDGNDVANSDYCHPLPFLTAFVFVIVTILWFAVILIVVVIVLLVGLTVGFKAYRESDIRPTEQILIISQSEMRRIMKDVKGETSLVKKLAGKRGGGDSGRKSKMLARGGDKRDLEADAALRNAREQPKQFYRRFATSSRPSSGNWVTRR